MSEEKKDSGGGVLSAAKDTVSVVGDLVKIAGDNPDVRAAGQQLGKAALTVSKTINAVLLPLAAVNFAVDRARDYFKKDFPDQLAEKAKSIPPETLVEPKASIAGPALQALAFAHEEESLREMYLNLLRSAMDSRAASSAHPAFVEVIRQLTSEEARLVAGALHPAGLPLIQLQYVTAGRPGHIIHARHITAFGDLRTGEQKAVPGFAAMVDNWSRLGLIHFTYSQWFVEEGRYSWIEKRPEVVEFRTACATDGRTAQIQRGLLLRTDFGALFASAVGVDTSGPGTATVPLPG